MSAAFAAEPPEGTKPFIGLYDAEGVLRCTGNDQAECLAYVELFALDPAVCSLVSLN